MTTPKASLRATLSVLYALGSVIPEKGTSASDLERQLVGMLDAPTLDGLLWELSRRRVIEINGYQISRGPEFSDGLERLRLAAASLRDGNST